MATLGKPAVTISGILEFLGNSSVIGPGEKVLRSVSAAGGMLVTIDNAVF